MALTSNVLGLAEVPAIALALFHSTFNVLGVLLVWPMTEPLAKFLLDRFKTAGEALGRPLHLDRNVQITPLLGLDALQLELQRMAGISREHAIEAVTAMRPSKSMSENSGALASLTDAVENYITQLERQRLPDDLSARLPLALRINNYVEEVATLSNELAIHGADVDAIGVGRIAEAVAQFRGQVGDLLRNCDPAVESFDSDQLMNRYRDLRVAWHDLKSNLLAAASRSEIPIGGLSSALERLRTCLRIAEQSTKLAVRSGDLNVQSDGIADTVPPDAARRFAHPI